MTALTFLQTHVEEISPTNISGVSGVCSVVGEVIQPEQEKECLEAEMTIHQLVADSYAFSDTELQRPSRCRPGIHGSGSSKGNGSGARKPIGNGCSIRYGQSRHVSNPESDVGLLKGNAAGGTEGIEVGEDDSSEERPSIQIIVEPPRQRQTDTGPDYHVIGDRLYPRQLHRKSLWEFAPAKGRLRDALKAVEAWTKRGGKFQENRSIQNNGLPVTWNRPPAESYPGNTLNCEQQSKLSNTHRHSHSFPGSIQQGMSSKPWKPLYPSPQVYPETHLFPPMPATIAAPICSAINVGSSTTSNQTANLYQGTTPLRTEIGNLDATEQLRREVWYKMDQLDRITADYANLKVLLDEHTHKHLQNLAQGLLQPAHTFRGLHLAITHLEGETYSQQTSLDNILMQACMLKSHYDQSSTAILTRYPKLRPGQAERDYFLRTLLGEDSDEGEDESGYDAADEQDEECGEEYGLKMEMELQRCEYRVELLEREIACLEELKQEFRIVREGVGSIARFCQIAQLQCRKQSYAHQHQHPSPSPPRPPPSPAPAPSPPPPHSPHLRASSQNSTSSSRRGRLLSRFGLALGGAFGLGSGLESW